jgi:hypothetical protein
LTRYEDGGKIQFGREVQLHRQADCPAFLGLRGKVNSGCR